MREADIYGVGRYSNDILANLSADDRATFMEYFDHNDFSDDDDIGDLPITQGTVLSPVPTN